MSHDQPTNSQPDQPNLMDYLSIRLKLDHKYIRQVIEVLNVPDYCIYKHKAGTSNEHFHICLPGVHDDASVEKYRKRLRTKFGGSGNGFISCKRFTNGLPSFAFYCSHEGTEACYEAPIWISAIEEGLKLGSYVKQTGQKMLPAYKSSKDLDADWQLTYANFVPKCINHARANGLTGGLKEVLQHLLEHTRWRPSFHMIKNGVPDYYYKDYEFRSGKRQKFDMDWMTPKF